MASATSNSLVFLGLLLVLMFQAGHGQSLKPTITAGRSRVQTYKYHDVTLTCEGTNAFKPFAMTVWTHNQREVKLEDVKKYTATDTFYGEGLGRTVKTTLTIKGVLERDEGEYRCYLITERGGHYAKVVLHAQAKNATVS